jgi:hypothetical protein
MSHLENKDKNKFPLSKYKYQCLTPCYPPNKSYLHPYFLELLHVKNASTCGVFYAKEYDTGKTTFQPIDECAYNPDVETDDDNVLAYMPIFEFNYTDFLNKVYGITNFDDVINWTNNNTHLSKYTIIRVHNCAWKGYGNELENISDTVVEYYYDLFSDMQNFKFTLDQFYELVKEYWRNNIKNWFKIESHYKNLKKYVYEHINL